MKIVFPKRRRFHLLHPNQKRQHAHRLALAQFRDSVQYAREHLRGHAGGQRSTPEHAPHLQAVHRR